MYNSISKVLELIDFESISEKRKTELQVLINYIKGKRKNSEQVRLNFICTHNSRRSQFAQVWADVAAYKHNIPIETYSGGVEITACNHKTIESLERFGFKVEAGKGENPEYLVDYSENQNQTKLFSKLYDSPGSPKNGFAAIMTCSQADKNCPFVSGCEKRISLTYDDPKLYDDSPLELAMYDLRSFQIATEMMYIFSKLSSNG